MLTLECPYCGVKADETELAAGGEAHLKRFGPGASDEDFDGYMFMRKNPQGRAFRTLAACLWLRQVVPRGALHGDARSVRHLSGADLRTARRSAG